MKWRTAVDRRAVAVPASGPGATNHFEAAGSSRSNDDVAYPNLMFHFLPIAVRYDGSRRRRRPRLPGAHRPDVLGRARLVKITSRDPRVHPALRFNYLSTEQDRREWVEAIRVARDILNQPAFDPFNAGELSPGRASRPTRRSSRGCARTARPRCTLVHGRMGTRRCRWSTPHDAGARPRGLRVVDASVMPYVTNGNIYAPVMMVAEKAADLILGNTPLPPRRSSSTGTDGRMRSPSTFHHVTLSVTDLPRSVDSYERVLGMAKVADREGRRGPARDAVRGRPASSA
jgi:choline dehydrogenase